MKTFKHLGCLKDIHWIIEVKVCLVGLMNHLLNKCQEWDEVLTLKREELREWSSIISVQGGHVTSIVRVKE